MKAKRWLIIALVLVAVGLLLFLGVMMRLNWDFTKLSTVPYKTNTYAISENYQHISIATDTADVVLVPCDEATTSVTCYEQTNAQHSVKVQDNTLVIEVIDTRKWHEHIGINFDTPTVTVYLPQGQYGTLAIASDTGDISVPKEFFFEKIAIHESAGDVVSYASATDVISIKTTTGNIHIQKLSAGSLDLAVSTGKIHVSDVICQNTLSLNVSTGKATLTNATCKTLTSNGNTGDLYLKKVIASEAFLIERDTGDVRLERCDADNILITTDTGSVKGTLLSEKIFLTQTDTGSVNVPKTTNGGRCEITTDTGNIHIEIEP